MQQRDNGSIPDDLSSLVPAKDELRGFSANPPKPKNSETKSTPKAARDNSAQTNSTGSTSAILVALIGVVLALAGFSAYSWQMAQIANQQLTQASDRIAALEGRVSTTDASVTESSGSLAARINDIKAQQDKLVGEVDKLWSSAWRENQKSIGANTEALKALDKRLDAIEKQTKENLSLAKQAAGDITVVKAQVDQAEEASKSIDDLRQNLNAQKKAVDKLGETADANKAGLQKLSKQVKDNEDWTSSFNEFRRQTNLQLEMMKEGSAAKK